MMRFTLHHHKQQTAPNTPEQKNPGNNSSASSDSNNSDADATSAIEVTHLTAPRPPHARSHPASIAHDDDQAAADHGHDQPPLARVNVINVTQDGGEKAAAVGYPQPERDGKTAGAPDSTQTPHM
jgi:hypothetical protein